MNTDKQALQRSQASVKIQIGEKLTQGRGAGSKPEVGRRPRMRAARPLPPNVLKDADMVFITAGMGGGTGTGAAPRWPRSPGNRVLTVGIVTKPFAFGPPPHGAGRKGHCRPCGSRWTLVVIPNERLKLVSEERITLANAFHRGRRCAAPGRAVHLRLDSAARHCQPGLRGREVRHAERRLCPYGRGPCQRQG